MLATHALLLLMVLVFRKSWYLNLIVMVSAGKHLSHIAVCKYELHLLCFACKLQGRSCNNRVAHASEATNL